MITNEGKLRNHHEEWLIEEIKGNRQTTFAVPPTINAPRRIEIRRI